MKRGPVKGALDREASYMYYLHGPLMRTEIGDLSVQGVDFAYTLHGWIKGVNSGTLKSDRDIGQDGEDGSDNEMVARDVYGYGLGYYRNDYTAIGQSSGDLTTTTFFMPALPTNSNYHSTVPELWNGNIRHMLTAIKPFLGGSGEPQGMSYTYDQLNRIQTSRAWVTINATGNTWQAGGGALDKYKEDYTYDGNGNIQTLTRYAVNGAGTTRMMDYFGYNYVSGTNKLAYVTDTVSSSAFTVDIDNQMGGNYDYDEIGNLIKDVSEEIDIIEWNVYGKIKAVTRGIMSTKPDLEFEYDPMGNRVLKRVITKGMSPRTIETLYIRDANGNEMASYTLAGDSVTWNSASIYGSSRLGLYEQDQLLEVDSVSVLTLPSDEGIVWRGYRKYELSNHLGNVLVVISDKRTTVCDGSNNVLYYEAEIVSAQDYYPFGMVMPGRTYASDEYKYGFNGKDKESDISSNNYDFGARLYSARIGRWFTLDFNPMPYKSNYVAFLDNPIIFIDPDGNTDYFYPDGTFCRSIEDGTNQIKVLKVDHFKLKALVLVARKMSQTEIDYYKANGYTDEQIEEEKNRRERLVYKTYSEMLHGKTFAISTEEERAKTLSILKNIYLHYDKDLIVDHLLVEKDAPTFENDANNGQHSIGIKPDGTLPRTVLNSGETVSPYASSYNLKSIILHERLHQTRHKDRGGSYNEAEAYLAQIEDADFSKTDDNFQVAMIERAKANIKNYDVLSGSSSHREGENVVRSESAKALLKRLEAAIDVNASKAVKEKVKEKK